ncbi:MAG: efflux RND transporter periplasmic adaptor subunit [Pseudomonadales bacterium]|nr:efflux RND transporter periplasmic adaptor subunit [Pseudomonadales bacterium]MCP5183233.1 efflux RND transporter periplasmic adaptor subunit [Pseudomonadales bacterium]
MRGTYITAFLIAAVLIAWLASGLRSEHGGQPPASINEANAQAAARADDRPPTRVRARVVEAESHTAVLTVRGRTENKRTVVVRAETSGKIAARPVERGSRVAAGDLLCRINLDARDASRTQAAEALNQARIDFDGTIRLKRQGLVADTAVASAKARLAAAEADVERAELEIRRTAIRAPFSGIVEDVNAELGDYVSPGAPCVTLVDLDPMLLVGAVAERDVSDLHVGKPVTGRLIDGRRVTGSLTFVGQQSDADTRTYPIEIELPNADHALRSGITAEIDIPVRETRAHKISPALLALDDAGNTGIRLLNDDNIVEFHQVVILNQENDGIWLGGLPARATIITVGQEMVVPGERVDPVFEPSGAMPAQSQPPSTDPKGAQRDQTGLSGVPAEAIAAPSPA